MYCPQCGREIDLDSGDVHFCRYCGFSLVDTKESLQGYSEQKRTGFSVVTWSYVLLLLVTLLLHGKYISVDTRWMYWFSAILIVASVSLFVSASVSALKPALFAKGKRKATGALESPDYQGNALNSAEDRVGVSSGKSGMGLGGKEKITARVDQPPSVTEENTRRFDD
jgi:hypothetical protein